MSFASPLVGVLRIPVDPVSAVHLDAAGHEIEGSRSSPVLVVRADAASPLVAEAGEHAEVLVDDDTGSLIIDLAANARRLIDRTPPIPADVPGSDPWPLWPKPRVVAYRPNPLHVTVDEDLVAQVSRWLKTLPSSGSSVVAELEALWQQQATRMLSHATDRARGALVAATPDEKRAVTRKLDWLAHLVRHGNDDPEAAEAVSDDGEPYFMSDDELIGRAYSDLLTACDRAAESEDDRDRSSTVAEELRKLALAYSDEMSDRLRLAYRSGLLEQSLGVARAELLGIALPGWRYLDAKEGLKDIRNPTLDALQALAAAESDFKHLRWTKARVELRWLVPGECAVLASEFLGRRVIQEVDA